MRVQDISMRVSNESKKIWMDSGLFTVLSWYFIVSNEKIKAKILFGISRWTGVANKQAVKTRTELIDDEDTRKINKGLEAKKFLLGTRLNKGEWSY
jgi:hypothetical protein